MAGVQEIDIGGGEILVFPDDMPDDEVKKRTREAIVKRNYTNPPKTPFPDLPAAPAPIKESESNFPTLRTLTRGTGAGVAKILDMPARGAHWTARNVFDYTPPGTATPFHDIYEALMPAPVEGYEGMHEAAETYGPALLAPFGVGAGLARGVAGYLGNVAVNAGLTEVGKYAGQAGKYVGGNVGSYVAEKLGMDPERAQQFWEDVGEAGAGVGLPALAARGGEAVVRGGLTNKKKSPELLKTFDEAGVRPTLGTIGNDKARVLEEVTRKIPLIGAEANNVRALQLEDINRGGREIAGAVRDPPPAPVPVAPVPLPPAAGTVGGGNLFGRRGRSLARERLNATARQDANPPPPPGPDAPITEGTVGKAGQEAVDAAILKNQGTISNIGDALDYVLVGRDKVGPSKNVDDTVAAIEADPGRGSGKIETLKETAKPLLADRKYPIDVNLASNLDLQRLYYEEALRQNTIPTQRPALEAALADTMKKIDENTGSTYGALKDNRGDIRKPVKDKPTVDTHLAKKVEDATTDAMGGIAEREGVPRADWDEFNRTMAERRGEIEYIEQAQANREGGGAYNKLFSKSNEADVKLQKIIEQRAPAELRKALADHLELKTRGEGSAGHAEITAQEMQGRISKWWNTLDNEGRDIAVGRDANLRKRMDALATVDKIIKGPDINSPVNVGGGSGPNMIPNAAARTTAALLAGQFGNIPAALIPLAISAATRKLSDPAFARRIVQKRGLVDIFDPRKAGMFAHGASALPEDEEERR